eukprot:2346364-Rhodomonas_salina.2
MGSHAVGGRMRSRRDAEEETRQEEGRGQTATRPAKKETRPDKKELKASQEGAQGQRETRDRKSGEKARGSKRGEA